MKHIVTLIVCCCEAGQQHLVSCLDLHHSENGVMKWEQDRAVEELS